MGVHSPKVFLNTPEMEPIGTVLGSDGLYRLAVTTDGSVIPVINPGNASVDAFGRERTSTPTSIFDSKQIYDNQPLLFAEYTVNGGTVSYQNQRASSLLQTTATLNSRAVRQTKRYFNYQPGKSQFILATFNLNGVAPGVTKRVGYFDDSNGIFIQLDSSGYSIVKRSNVSGVVQDTPVSQANWNLDTLNGLGPSGKDLDSSAVIILAIDFEWLGVGAVRVGFDFGNQLVYAHRFAHANESTSVYMQTPNLPVRWEVLTSSGTSSGTRSVEAICCSVQSEGGANPLSVQRTVSRGVTGASINTTLQSILSLRLKSAYNRATVFPLYAAAVTTDQGISYWGQLLYNATFGVAPTWSPLTNSAAEYSSSVTTVSGGTVLAEFYGIAGDPGKSGAAASNTLSQLASAITLAADYAGTSDTITLAIRTISNASANSMYGLIDWLEYL